MMKAEKEGVGRKFESCGIEPKCRNLL